MKSKVLVVPVLAALLAGVTACSVFNDSPDANSVTCKKTTDTTSGTQYELCVENAQQNGTHLVVVPYSVYRKASNGDTITISGGTRSVDEGDHVVEEPVHVNEDPVHVDPAPVDPVHVDPVVVDPGR